MLRTPDEQSEDDYMAASDTTGLSIPLTNQQGLTVDSVSRTSVRRRVTREAELGMKILGHAIEHLSEESVYEEDLSIARKGDINAVKLLMALNSRIYAGCPEVPSLRDRFEAFLGRI